MELAIGGRLTIADVTDMLCPALRESSCSVSMSLRPRSAIPIEEAMKKAHVSAIKSLLPHITKAENLPLAVEFLRYMFELIKTHEKTFLNSYIEAMIEEAIQQNSLELVKVVDQLIDPWYCTGNFDAAVRQPLEEFVIQSTQLDPVAADILASMYSRDGALVKSLIDRNLLGTMLKKALSTDADGLLVELCIHTNNNDLRWGGFD